MEMMVNGLRVDSLPTVYEPAEDTFLLAEKLSVEEGYDVLDIGTGTGFLSLLCAAKAKRVVAVDIDKEAALCAKLNARRNGIKNVNVICGDLFSALARDSLFDLVIFNPPYLPEDGEAASSAWSGGPDGRAVINRFLAGAKQHLKTGGRLLTIGSSLSNYEETIRALKSMGFKTETLAKKRFFFEELVVIEASLPTNPSSRPSKGQS